MIARQALFAGATALFLVLAPAATPAVAAPDTVVATFQGDPVTLGDLQFERQSAGLHGADEQTTNKMAMARILNRRIVAAAARADGLDKSPEYRTQVRRGEETLLAQLYERKLQAGLAAPTPAEAQAYIDGHPKMFAQRRLMFVTEVTAAPKDSSIDRFKTLHSLDDVLRLLEREGTPYLQTISAVDSAKMAPDAVAALESMAPNDVTITPGAGGTLQFSVMNESRLAPLRGPPAIAAATAALRQQRSQDAGRAALRKLIQAAASSISYRSGYELAPAEAP
jgi:EpsD family peptidyl-prolyl cis-trans isomerase